jgi:hypothetical protein
MVGSERKISWFIIFPLYVLQPHLNLDTWLSLDSGHGGQVEDQDGDEIDGFDEGSSNWNIEREVNLTSWFLVIFPLDFKQNGHILDDVCSRKLWEDISETLTIM